MRTCTSKYHIILIIPRPHKPQYLLTEITHPIEYSHYRIPPKTTINYNTSSSPLIIFSSPAVRHSIPSVISITPPGQLSALSTATCDITSAESSPLLSHHPVDDLCASIYSDARANWYRYELEPEELELLRMQLERLEYEGYKWPHDYTQCVMRILLDDLRYR